MEDNLNFLKMEDDLNFFENLKMRMIEDDYFFLIEDLGLVLLFEEYNYTQWKRLRL